MRGAWSLRWRLWLAGGLGVVLAALVAGHLLGAMFARSGERMIDRRLDDDFATLAGLLEAGADGGWRLRREPADERWQRIFSGAYWRIGEGDRVRVSRSLWDDGLQAGPAPAPGPAHWRNIEGPRGQALRARIQQLRLPGTEAPVPVLVAIDRTDVLAGTREFRRMAMLAFAAAAAVLLVLLAWQVEWGLRPLRRMRAILAQVRNGDDVRFGTDAWPAEAAPLAAQIDELLDDHARRVARARHAAQDLAHALKTPLSVLSAEAQRPGPEIAAVVAQQVARMQGEVDRRLVGGLTTDARQRTRVAPVAESLRMLFRHGPAAALRYTVEAQADGVFAGAQEDLAELLGNLVDNAAKWARTTVVVRAVVSGGRLRIEVDDDGPGLPAKALERARRRGVRHDEHTPGHGLGLAIVDDIARGYGGTLSLANREGGFTATLDLPAG